MSQRTVLIVGTNSDDHNILRDYLTQDGTETYTVASVHTGGDALRLLEIGASPDCILLGDLLPDMDGFGALAALTDGKGKAHCPVVMLSTETSPAMAVRAIKGGAEDYLVKEEITPESLRSAVANAIEKEALQRALHESRAQFEAAFTDAPNGMAFVAPEGRWLKVNPALTAFLGYSEAELLARDFQSLTHPDDISRNLMWMNQALEGQARAYQIEKRYFRKDGNIVWGSMSTTLVRDTQDIPLYFVVQIKDITERKETQLALQISEERLRLAMKGGHIGAFDWNLKTNVIEWSGEIEGFMGMAPGSFERTFAGFRKLVHPDDREAVQRCISEAIRGSGAYECEFRMIKGDGSIRWVIGKGSVFYDEDGIPERMVGIDFDITQRKRAEEALETDKERLRACLSASSIGSWDWNIRSGTALWSPENYRLYGIDPASGPLLHADLEGTIHPGDRAAVNEAMRKVIEGQTQEINQEFRIVRQNGEVRWLLCLGRMERDTNDAAIRMLGLKLDITERKMQEEQRKLYEKVILTTNDAILITEAEPLDAPGPRILFANPAFTKMTGYTAEEVMGQNPRLLQGPKSDRRQLQRLRNALENGEPVRVELTNYRKDGSEFEVEFEIAPVADGTGWYTHWISIQRDNTERKRQMEEITDLNTRLHQAVFESSHRIKNHLQVLGALVELQILGREEPIPVAEVQRIGYQIKTLAAIHDVLTLTTRENAEHDSLSTQALLEHIVPLLQQMAGAQSIDFTVDDTLLSARQASALVLVLNELVSNAIKHGQGDVLVRFLVLEGRGVLEVCDVGGGFPVGFDARQVAHTGLELVEAISHTDLRGQTVYDTRPEGGGRVRVSFPLS